MWGERGVKMAPPPMHDSAESPCFHGCPAFPPQAFPTTISTLTSPWSISPQSTAALPLGIVLQLPAAAPSRGPATLSRVCMVTARTVCFSFHLGCHRSAVSLSALNVSPLTQTIAPMWGLDPCFSSPTCWGQVGTTNTPASPASSSSYWVLHGSIYSFPLVRHFCSLSAGLLHALQTQKYCIPDVSVERDILHIHLLLCHLVLDLFFFWCVMLFLLLY